MIDVITICGAWFKAPTNVELSVPLFDKMIEDMKLELEDQRKSWTLKGCIIMTNGWMEE